MLSLLAFGLIIAIRIGVFVDGLALPAASLWKILCRRDGEGVLFFMGMISM